MNERMLNYIMDELEFFKSEYKKAENHLTEKISQYYDLEEKNKK